MDIRFDFSNIRSLVVGPEHGLADKDIEQCIPSIERILGEIDARRQTGELAYLDLPYQETQAKHIEQTANEIANEFDTFVRGAMAECSDEAVAPGHVTYDNVSILIKEIKASMEQ